MVVKTIYLLLTIFLLCISCQPGTKETKVMSHADSLRRAQAIEIKKPAMITFFHTGGIDSLDFILSQLDKAIQTDSTFTQAYKDKALVLASEKDYGGAIEILRTGYPHKTSDFQFLVFTGFLYQKQTDTIQAYQFYRKAINVCDEQIKLYPDSVYFYREKALMLGFLHNSKDTLLHEFKRIQSRFPKDMAVPLLIEMFQEEKNTLQNFLSNIANYEFIKEEYIKTLPPERQKQLRAKTNTFQ